MPKQNKGKMVVVPFHYLAAFTLAGGTFGFVVRPDNFSTALSSISDAYELFCVKRLKFRIFAKATAAAVGVVGSVPNTQPSTIPQVMELLDSVQHEATLETKWSDWVNVRKEELAGPFAWYHTRAGTFDVTESAPCTVSMGGTGTAAIDIEFRGVFMFKDTAATADTPMAAALKRRLREDRAAREADVLRARVLGIIAPPSVPSTALAQRQDARENPL
jgi:hypothetical protein